MIRLKYQLEWLPFHKIPAKQEKPETPLKVYKNGQ